MNPVVTWATTTRILRQLRRDPRTVALVIVVPSVLLVLLRYVFDDERMFNSLDRKSVV